MVDRRNRSGLLASLALALVVAGLTLPAVAQAHKPVFLPTKQAARTPEAWLGDGTTSYAVYGALATSEQRRSVGFRLDSGDELFVELLIPDRPPEAQRPARDQPQIVLTGPDGSEQTLVCKRVGPSFYEPFSMARYRTIIHLDRRDAQGGKYLAVIEGPKASRFTLAVGKVERFGARDLATLPSVVGKAQAWYRGSPVNADSPTRTRPATVAAWSVFLLVPALVVGAIVWLFMRSRRRRKRGSGPAAR